MSSDADLRGGESAGGNVPVFSCIVYLSSSDGQVKARVANLAGLEFNAANEREALAKTVAAFKQRVAELMQEKSRIPWVDPPAEPAPDEQQRFVPIHL